jgi:hypothetical protein
MKKMRRWMDFFIGKFFFCYEGTKVQREIEKKLIDLFKKEFKIRKNIAEKRKIKLCVLVPLWQKLFKSLLL